MHANPTLLLTRPLPQSQRFAQMCRDAIGAELPVLISPLQKIVPRAASLSPDAFGDVILTSANGAQALAAVCDVRGKTAFCVGHRTAQVARDLGMIAHSANGAAKELIALIQSHTLTQPLLHARGRLSRGDVAETLKRHGYHVVSAVLYQQEPCDLSAEAQQLLHSDSVILAPLFSPRSAKVFSNALKDFPAKPVVFPLSPAVFRAYDGAKTAIQAPPPAPNAAALCDLIARYYNGGSG